MNARFLILILALCFAGSVQAQSLSGIRGLVTVPTAELPEDATLTTGFNLLHRSNLQYHRSAHHAKSPYVSLVYLPFMEIGLRLTRADSQIEEALGDRSIYLRVRPLSERGMRPALLLGIHDFIGLKRHFQATYAVASKTFTALPALDHVSVHLGYGTKVIDAELYDFVGLFGGIAVAPHPKARLLAEFVGGQINLGVDAALFRHATIIVGLTDFRAFSGGVSYAFKLPQ